MLISKEYVLVIDTNSYSHKFYKELCAFCTGMIDEKNAGNEFADMFFDDRKLNDDDYELAEQKNPFYESVGLKLDEDGIYSPCCVWLNKRYGINSEGEFALLSQDNFEEFNFPAPLSVGIFFEEEPSSEQIDIIKSRTEIFFNKIWKERFPGNKPIVLEGFRLIAHTKYGEEISL